MALLSLAKRAQVWRDMMAAGRTPPDVAKADVRLAIDGADAWVDGNWLASTSTSFNSSLPQPYRGAATRKDKAFLLQLLCAARAGEDV